MTPKKRFSEKWFVTGFTLAAGLGLIAFAILRVAQTEAFIHRAGQTTGTVLSAKQGVLVWSAVVTVEFRDAAGTRHTAAFEPGRDTTARQTGDVVALLYDPDDPSAVYLGNPRGRRYVMAGIFFLLGAGLIRVTLRPPRRPLP